MHETRIGSDIDSTKSASIVLLLCIFLGNFGIHRFYVGKIATGILMLFTFGGLGIWYLIDLAFIISNKFTDNKGNIIELAKNPPRFKKIMTVFGVMIIVFYGFWISIITQAILASNQMIEVAKNQLGALQSGDIDKAYGYTSENFRYNTTPENFKEFIKRYRLENNDPTSFSEGEMTIGQGEIKGTLKLNDGTLFFIKYHLTKENKEWKIQDIELKPLGSEEQKNSQ
ncbi:MAG TPA: DUF4864 domain-containing protein [Gammaproteobacteria bacterium]|nr:DUF4864 domain-containing protein [Gammaproteobacteria bacterium]